MAKKEKEPKTNAVRIVAAKKIPYTLHTYDAPEGFLDGVSVAAQTGQDVYKRQGWNRCFVQQRQVYD